MTTGENRVRSHMTNLLRQYRLTLNRLDRNEQCVRQSYVRGKAMIVTPRQRQSRQESCAFLATAIV